MYEHDSYSLELLYTRCANMMNFLCQGFRSYCLTFRKQNYLPRRFASGQKGNTVYKMYLKLV